MTKLLRRTVLAGGFSALGLAGASGARSESRLVDLQVVDRETGQAARVWRYRGRLFVAGQPGARYGLRVRNQTGGRVLAVISVDGVNILTGETAGFGQRGYVFGPYETYDVTGWRKTSEQVAAFTFAPMHRSYAALTGRPDDVGVIGLAAFSEKYVPPPVYPEARDQSAADSTEEVVVTGSLQRSAPAPATQGLAAPTKPSEKLGTAHGQREWSSVTLVNFERATSQPQQISRLEYDSTENLIAAGVIPRTRPAPPPNPRPFPASPPGYVPDPPYGR